jgi:hypothetical protein
MANGHGGKRPGAGAKPKAATILKRLAIEAAAGEAEKSLALLVEIRDTTLDNELKRACCNDIMDRVWGRAKQSVGVKVQGRMVLVCQGSLTKPEAADAGG